jgi:hypothetical protein
MTGTGPLRALASRSAFARRAVRRVRAARAARFRTRLRFDDVAPALILSPHLDDAVLNCWSVLAGGEPVVVVNVFAGLPPAGAPAEWDRLSEARDARSRMAERHEEDREALGAVGASAVNLGLLEEPYRGWRSPSLASIDGALAEQVASASRVYAPLGVTHTDHKLVRRHALGIGAGGVPVTLYGEVPQGSLYGWPHWATGERPRRYLVPEAHWEDALVQAGLDPAARPRVARLDDEQSAAKLRALEAYRTQFPALDGGPIGVLRNRAIRDFELFWDVP